MLVKKRTGVDIEISAVEKNQSMRVKRYQKRSRKLGKSVERARYGKQSIVPKTRRHKQGRRRLQCHHDRK
jgi:hypothetical protein